MGPAERSGPDRRPVGGDAQRPRPGSAAGRIRDDLADPVERERFLQQLVAGLRRDLRSVELTELTLGERRAADDGSVAVELLSPSQLPGIDAWPAGRLVLSCDADRGWVVDRLEPRLAGP